ncbi:MAG: hypothetical protein GY724_03310 [Actinomycetia bacterium]|nr:hypothetical protein [Actinomycetes bacterium]MCP5032975.1 hypothetical protein [Actinomycetes bacterium]
MGALANYIERAGVATASISLIREQSEAVRPPRALWVPFALGRPLGSAEDPDFQKDVIRASLNMLATVSKPTIEDYQIEAPDEAGPGVWACPLNLEVTTDDSYAGRLRAEVARLHPWAEETRTSRGRTLFGVTGAEPDQVDEVARALGSIADSGQLTDPPAGDIEWAFTMPLLVRHLADDLRTFYHEAIAAQPGPSSPNHDALNEWIFGGTALGEVLQQVANHLTAADTHLSKLVRGFLIPEGHYRGGSAFPSSPEFGTGSRNGPSSGRTQE